MIADIELEQKFSHVYPEELCQEPRYQKVSEYLAHIENPYQLPVGFDMRAVTDDGKFVKRCAAAYRKTTGVNMGEWVKSTLGTVYEDASPNNELYTFDFTTRLDWDGGKFGDDGSCFMGTGSGYRTTSVRSLEESGVMAMRFWRKTKKSNEFEGYARCWVIAQKTRIVLFNAYGMTLRRMAEILSDWSNIPLITGPVNLRPMSDGHDMYINDDTCRVLGEKPESGNRICFKFEYVR